MQDQIQIQVTSMQKKEYIQLGFETVRRLLLPMLALVTLVVLAIALAIQDMSVRSLLPPYVLIALGVLAYYIMIALSWKDFLADTKFSYVIDDYAWQLTVGEETVQVKWSDTVRMTVRSRVILLYNEDNRSNLLPRRCVTPEQLAQLRQWFRDSRMDYKISEAEKTAKFRADYRKRRAQAKRNRRNRWNRSNHL